MSGDEKDTTAGGSRQQSGGMDRLHDDLQSEYFRIVGIIEGFDQRLLTIKSWGVTFALATLGFGFQQGHYGLFLVAAAAALAFWLIEGSVKLHQMRYYPRMGDIEVISYELWRENTPSGPASSPLIDWSFFTAWPRLRGGKSKGDPRRPRPWKEINDQPGRNRWVLFYPHVALPHAIVVVLGLVLFVVGLTTGTLGPI
ncbi:hypothetical protein ACFT30_10485 [Microbacterium ureisolvens]|uniref:hypothetical protein n=1 Tax=Microbacterium ureisolvens TaxID=2781186 RepID=UPI0036310806